MRTRRRRFRIAFRIAKVLLVIVVLFAVAVGLLFLLTPSAGQATALTRAQARDRHITYPGPPVPA
jgi:cytochrome oxidase Cu insertion factor (SCO1/SenC/PrrC family)